MLRTELTEMLGIQHPIVQAGMGPWNTEALAVASANAGALGIVSTSGLAYKMSPPTALEKKEALASTSPYDLLRMTLDWVGERTAEAGGIFGVNIPLAQEFRELTESMIQATSDARNEHSDLADRLKVIVTAAGDPIPWTAPIKESGALWFHVAPSVKHALKGQMAGADVIIASGREGGGHVSFQPVHSMVLLPAVVSAVDLPVVAAGGFCDGGTLVSALAMGAIGVQMGTRFIATQESDFVQVWKDKILDADELGSVVGISVFGPARYLKNKVSLRLHELLNRGFEAGYEEGLDLEGKGIQLSMEGKDTDMTIFFGGEAAGRISEVPTVAELLRDVSSEAERVIERLPGCIASESP
ncbi:MAG: nitronate monooxygenase [Deltaproteobacteria bacterium]|nr:nitronate monooxygenase [Deltaproteobacteria bacterium]MBW2361582.1 nitronate monooxygenase [Deltaproteobacteria bacterium]